jgi:hypothetical protein
MALMKGPCIFLRAHASREGPRKVASSNMGKNCANIIGVSEGGDCLERKSGGRVPCRPIPNQQRQPSEGNQLQVGHQSRQLLRLILWRSYGSHRLYLARASAGRARMSTHSRCLITAISMWSRRATLTSHKG